MSFNSPTPFNELDNFRDNWWCSSSPSKSGLGQGGDFFRMFAGVSIPLRQIYPDGKIPTPAFLNASDRAEGKTELTALASQPAAPNWLGEQTLDFAKSHPDDSRVPEALHLVVRARRYGCSGESPDNSSKQAFTLLHKKYADSEWTSKTPYWFE
jgi:hypothetical protein